MSETFGKDLYNPSNLFLPYLRMRIALLQTVLGQQIDFSDTFSKSSMF